MKKRFVIAFAAALPLVCGTAFGNTLKLAYDADPVSLDLHEQLSGGTLQLSHMVSNMSWPHVSWISQ